MSVRNLHILHGARVCATTFSEQRFPSPQRKKTGHRHSHCLLMERVKVKTVIPTSPAASSAFFSPHLRQAFSATFGLHLRWQGLLPVQLSSFARCVVEHSSLDEKMLVVTHTSPWLSPNLCVLHGAAFAVWHMHAGPGPPTYTQPHANMMDSELLWCASILWSRRLMLC